jgi:hypothetical protein
LVAKYQCARKPDAILEPDLDRADVGHEARGPVGESDFLARDRFELQADADLLWNAKVNGAGVRHGLDLRGAQLGLSRVP